MWLKKLTPIMASVSFIMNEKQNGIKCQIFAPCWTSTKLHVEYIIISADCCVAASHPSTPPSRAKFELTVFSGALVSRCRSFSAPERLKSTLWLIKFAWINKSGVSRCVRVCASPNLKYTAVYMSPSSFYGTATRAWPRVLSSARSLLETSGADCETCQV